MNWGAKLRSADDQAIKILGKGAKVPKGKLAAAEKANTEWSSRVVASWTALDNFNKCVDGWKVALALTQTAVNAYGDEISACNFGLDTNSSENKKKIAQARHLYAKVFAEIDKHLESSEKAYREVEKHVNNIFGYKK